MRRDIDYISARLMAKKSRLLGAARMAELTRLGSAQEFLKMLGDTFYAPHLEKVTSKRGESLESIFTGLGSSLFKEFSEIRAFSESMAEEPCRYLFALWDIENLKRIFRGLKDHKSVEVIMNRIVMAGWVNYTILKEIASSQSLHEGAERAFSLGVIPRSVLIEAFSSKTSKGEFLAALELAVDRWFYTVALQWFDKNRFGDFWEPIKRSLAYLVEARNIFTLIVAANWGEPPLEVELLQGGRHTPLILLKRTSDVKDKKSEIAEIILETFGRVGEQCAVLTSAGNFTAAGEALYSAAWRRQINFLSEDHLTSAILIGYLWAKIGEVVDLRNIAGSIHFGLLSEGREIDLISL